MHLTVLNTFVSQRGRDVAAIALANANMGDYKLKSSPDYEVNFQPSNGGLATLSLSVQMR